MTPNISAPRGRSDSAPAQRDRHVGPADPPQPPKTGRYRLDVVGPDVPEIVCGLGGWLFDHATAGWDVRARIETVTGERALRILGAEMSDFGETLSLSYWTEAPDVVAVSVRACLQHKPIRQGILHALENFRTDVLLWGDHCPSSLLRAHHAVPVHCSLAARAFADIARAATDGGCVSSPATLFRLTPGRAHPVRRRRHGVRPSWASGHTNGQGAHA